MFEPTSSGAPKSSTTIRTAAPPVAAAGSGSAGGPAAAPQAPYAADNDVHLLDRLAVLYRYRRLCVTVFILVTAAMIIQGYSNVKVFQAQARLLIEDERSTAVPGLQNDQNTFYEDPEPYYQTQYKILKGARPDPARGAEAAPRERARVQRQEAAAADAALDAGRRRPAAHRLRQDHAAAGARAAQGRRAGRRIGDGRRLRRPGRRSAGARQPSGRRHVRLGGTRLRRRRREHV